MRQMGETMLERVFRQQRDVRAAVAQRRQRDGDDVDAIVEVLAKASLGDFLGQVAIGGGDQADVDPDRLVAADAAQLALLQDAQKLGLQADVEVGDLVEKER